MTFKILLRLTYSVRMQRNYIKLIEFTVSCWLRTLHDLHVEFTVKCGGPLTSISLQHTQWSSFGKVNSHPCSFWCFGYVDSWFGKFGLHAMEQGSGVFNTFRVICRSGSAGEPDELHHRGHVHVRPHLGDCRAKRHAVTSSTSSAVALTTRSYSSFPWLGEISSALSQVREEVFILYFKNLI